MRSLALAVLLFALAACNRGGDAEQLASGTNELNAAQIDAALGPADQSAIEDALPYAQDQNGVAGNESQPTGNASSPAADEEDGQ